MSNNWFSVRALAPNTAEVNIFGEIGSDITFADFNAQVAALGPIRALTVRINSPGGDVFTGNGILALLQRRKATGTAITVIVEGLAASMASVIATVGAPTIMAANSMLMLHNPSGAIAGTAAEMASWSDTLKKIGITMIGVYAAKTGLPPDKIAQLMDAETWLTAPEALALGFADEIEAPVQVAATFGSVLAHYRHAPPAAFNPNDPALVGDKLEDLRVRIENRQRAAAGRKPKPDPLAKAPSLAEQAIAFNARQKGLRK